MKALERLAGHEKTIEKMRERLEYQDQKPETCENKMVVITTAEYSFLLRAFRTMREVAIKAQVPEFKGPGLLQGLGRVAFEDFADREFERLMAEEGK